MDWEAREYWQQRPDRRPVMYQSWQQLAFLHWQVPADWLAKQLPPFLTLDTFAGQGWLGIVPFQMRNVRPAGLPSVGYLSNFLELNVRTYVLDSEGRPGVWFFSLSANRLAAVLIGRNRFRLPYFWSRMADKQNSQGWIHYQCQRRQPKGNSTFHFRYRPKESYRTAPRRSLEFFLVERYLLFAANPRDKNRSLRGQVHHRPYQVCDLEVERADFQILELDQLSEPWGDGIQEAIAPDHALFCRGVDVEIFSLQV